MPQENVAKNGKRDQLLQSLVIASDRLTADFGKWQTPWGDINRFQRLTGDTVHPFDDAKPSIPVGFTSGNWGSLASFGARPTPTTKKWYERQQFRGGRRIRQNRPSQSRDSRGRKRQPIFKSLQRPGNSIQHRQSSGRLFLSFTAQWTH
jgi:acyl-homoserine lactone acylase PvdQ